MSKTHPLLLAVALLLVFHGQKASAEASGPDYFQITADQAVILYEKSDLNAKVLGLIPANTTGLKNLGCTGFVTYEEWCKISYKDQMGWIQNIHLGENGKSSSPTFDCKKAKGEIEALICSNPDLINLDHQLTDTYQQALAKASSLDTQPDKAVKNLKALQRGWIKGRNECWKELEEKKSCVQTQYERRIAYLQAQWVLVPPSKTVRFECENKGEEFFAAFFVTLTIPSVAVEYGDHREIFVSSPAASGAKYTGDFGRYLWIKGDKATFVWEPAQPEKSCYTH